ncbi:hypothetical protein LINPERHAP1_LOCUS17473, partial [Linum perenne]
MTQRWSDLCYSSPLKDVNAGRSASENDEGYWMGDELIDIVIRHGGRMDFSGSEPKYVGGEENVVGFDTDYLSYHTLLTCAKEDLGYQTVDQHTCPRALVNKQASAKWIAKTYLEKFRINPKWDISDMKRKIQLTYGIGINSNKCYRARNEARTLLEGTLEDEYKKLRPYVAALQRADPEGQFILEVDIHQEDKVSFKRMYVGFSSLFKGFLDGCRPILGFDGCFLKGELPGMLLSTVGKDGNNQMFPLAWAVTEGENTSAWK